MTGYQFNKLAGAILAALLLFFGSRELINIFGSHEAPQKPGYDVPVSEEAAEATGEKPAEGEAPAGGEPIGALLAAANVEAGAADAKICGTCHAFEAGAAAKIGPNLHGVAGRDIASVEGFQYSPALTGKEGAWTYEALDAFLKSPKDFAPGTKMVFPGVKEAKKRADLIVYLKSISPDAPALPAADAPAAEAGKEAAPPAEAAKEGEAAEAEEQAAAEETEQTPAGGEAPQGDPAAPPPGAEAPASPPAPEAPPPPEQAAPAEQPAPQAEQQAAPAEQQAAPAEQPAAAAPEEQPAAEPQSAPAPESGAPPAAEPAPATASGAGNVEAGMKAAKICQTCHAFEAGAPAKIGPNLYGVVGRPIGGAEGFQYSPALKDKGGNWDEATLAKFLESPKGFAPGTKMIYPGIKDEKKRADMIAYLKSLSQ